MASWTPREYFRCPNLFGRYGIRSHYSIALEIEARSPSRRRKICAACLRERLFRECLYAEAEKELARASAERNVNLIMEYGARASVFCNSESSG
jgi:hypothetical protein